MVIKMNDYKDLIITSRSTLYQNENLVDKILFLLPEIYSDIPLKNFTWNLEYVNAQNEAKSEILELVIDETDTPELYKDMFLQYKLPITTLLSKTAGITVMKLTGVWMDVDTEISTNTVDDEGHMIYANPQYVLKTGEVEIEIKQFTDIFAQVTDDTLSTIDQKILKLNQVVSALAKTAGSISASVPNDLAINEESILHLTVNGEPIGSGVEITNDSTDPDSDHDGIIHIINL